MDPIIAHKCKFIVTENRSKNLFDVQVNVITSTLSSPLAEKLELSLSNLDPLQQLELNQQQQTFKVSALRVIKYENYLL